MTIDRFRQAISHPTALPIVNEVRALFRVKTAVIVVGLVVGLAYASWPLGYALNPSTARGALASTLETAGQPFAWLFVLLDCVVGAGTLFVAALALPNHAGRNERAVRVGLVFYAAFGVLTAVDALIPSDCGASRAHVCAANLSQLNLDDVLTGVSTFALFVAATSVALHVIRSGSSRSIAIALGVITVGWAGCGLALFPRTSQIALR